MLNPFIVLQHFKHKASMTSVNAEANVHSADWLMSTFVNDLGSQGPAPCTQSTRSVSPAVPKDYERDFSNETDIDHVWNHFKMMYTQVVHSQSSIEVGLCSDEIGQK